MEKEQTIWKLGNTEIKKFWYEPESIFAVKKTISNLTERKFKLKMQEIENLKSVQNCECCIKYYGFLKENQNYYSLTIITEYCERGDLNDMLKERKRNGNPFTSSELFRYFESLISYFSILQKRKIAHRDIKPENIFVTNDYKLKIGDFGCATDQFERELFTIQGTKVFFSPELLIAFVNEDKIAYLKHNPFKSDVYSLGLVFLCMATLQTYIPISKIKETRKGISNSRIKSLISVMLKKGPNSRPDFISLEEFFQSLKDDICCNLCHNSVNKESFFCKNCNLIFHKICIINIECPGCKQVFFTKCESCGVQLLASLNCMNGHQVCEYCKFREMRYIECKYCLGFMISDKFQSQEKSKNLKYKCVCCHNRLESYGDSECYFCNLCKLSYCKNCKQNHYYDKFGYRYPSQLSCNCGTICIKNIWDDIFYFCQNCYEKVFLKELVYPGNCCVCLDYNKSHISCLLNHQERCFY
ncbi:hypothetical protein SteCoe_23885 [Stentor coeruleus]|uniref:Protein kinase domain-containing protein n=1 Tax=Stentor coeruleus TaxID=5963 RepID=A0A1R2BIX0_9CILI|nr:hypothetical protein SteCoe_23885 [Stentor coeruleus]